MDANTRRRLEIEGYCELGMWHEAQSLLEEFAQGIAEAPEILAFLVMLGVALEFRGAPAGSQPLPKFFVPTAAHAYRAWGRAELATL